MLTALRDAENRLMFCGYDPRGFKLFVWVLSAVLCGLAGALYVPQVGIINPSEMSPTNSIEAAVWVALGGRGTLIGPLLGAGVVNGMKSWFTVAFPEYWLFFLGALFIIVTLYLPKGVIGLLKKGVNNESHCDRNSCSNLFSTPAAAAMPSASARPPARASTPATARS